MEKLIIPLLLNMLWIGPLQVLIALIGLGVSKSERKKKNYVFYLTGVAFYFLVLPTLKLIDKTVEYPVMFQVFFFGGAFLLMLYNLAIVMGAFTVRLTETREAHAG